MSDWEVKQPLDYSATGDDIDSASQKIIATFVDVYDKLNRLRTFDAGGEHSVGDASPYSIKIDTSVTPAAILMRNGTDTGYVQIGSVADNMGISAEDIGGIQGEGMGKISMGKEEDLPNNATTYDLYFAYNTGRLYIYRTGTWRVFLSLRFEDLLGVDDSVIKRDEVAESGSNKIPRLNSVGQGEFDITGNAAKIGDKNLFLPELRDGCVLVFNAAHDHWEIADRDDITMDDVSTTGEPDKIVKTDSQGSAHVNITGNAARVGNKAVDAKNWQAGDALVYDGDTETLKNKQIPVLNDSGSLDANITGSAAKWAGANKRVVDIQDGQVLAWNESENAFVNVNQSGIGNARNLVLRQNDTVVAEYNGSERTVVDMPAIVVSTTEPARADIWIKPVEE